MELPEDFDPDSEAGRAALKNLEATLGMGDVKDAFHRYRMRDGLAAYFCLGTASAPELGIGKHNDGSEIPEGVDSGGFVYVGTAEGSVRFWDEGTRLRPDHARTFSYALDVWWIEGTAPPTPR